MVAFKRNFPSYQSNHNEHPSRPFSDTPLMPIDFSKLAQSASRPIIDPRQIFTTLPNKGKKFSYLRDVQGQVLERWFERRSSPDNVIKMNTGAGKTTVGLLCLLSSQNEGYSPAVYITPDRFLTSQVVQEAKQLGIAHTTNEDDVSFIAGKSILITHIHKIFNGLSRFGVAQTGRKIPIGSILVDDAHACLETTREQFRITLDSDHPAYTSIRNLFDDALRQQNPRAALDIRNADPTVYLEIPFWAWHKQHDAVLTILHEHKDTAALRFTFPLIADVLPLCRCVLSGRSLEIAPSCIPVDVIPSFSQAARRIYMTATLSDDSVLITEFDAEPQALEHVITPKTADDLGERMIMVPQEIDTTIKIDDIKRLLVQFASSNNVVVIVPSRKVAQLWDDVAAQTLHADNLVQGVDRLRREIVGITVLVNKYDGIDLPDDACRILVINELPEAISLIQRADSAALDESEVTLRRQIQRIEQGMGRGVRSNEDHCVVLLIGSRLSRRIHQPAGRHSFTAATREQLSLSDGLTEQLRGQGAEALGDVIRMCLSRDPGWIEASKRSLLNIEPPSGGHVESFAVALRAAFKAARAQKYPAAAEALQDVVNNTTDGRLQGWLKARMAEFTDFYDQAHAQRLQLSAYEKNSQLVRPLKGVGYQKLTAEQRSQAENAIAFIKRRFIEHTDLILWINELREDLVYSPDTPSEKFEGAIYNLALVLGFNAQRPGAVFKQGPDGLWVTEPNNFLVIECKNRSVGDRVSKDDVDQLSGSINWFRERYGDMPSFAPILCHPKIALEGDAVPPQGCRIIDAIKINELKTAIEGYGHALAAPGAIDSPERVRSAIIAHGFLARTFVDRYTQSLTRGR